MMLGERQGKDRTASSEEIRGADGRRQGGGREEAGRRQGGCGEGRQGEAVVWDELRWLRADIVSSYLSPAAPLLLLGER